MNTSYDKLNKKVVTAITANLLNADALPPNTEVTALALEISETVFRELAAVGLTEERIEGLITEPVSAVTARRG